MTQIHKSGMLPLKFKTSRGKDEVNVERFQKPLNNEWGFVTRMTFKNGSKIYIHKKGLSFFIPKELMKKSKGDMTTVTYQELMLAMQEAVIQTKLMKKNKKLSPKPDEANGSSGKPPITSSGGKDMKKEDVK